MPAVRGKGKGKGKGKKGTKASNMAKVKKPAAAKVEEIVIEVPVKKTATKAKPAAKKTATKAKPAAKKTAVKPKVKPAAKKTGAGKVSRAKTNVPSAPAAEWTLTGRFAKNTSFVLMDGSTFLGVYDSKEALSKAVTKESEGTVWEEAEDKNVYVAKKGEHLGDVDRNYSWIVIPAETNKPWFAEGDI